MAKPEHSAQTDQVAWRGAHAMFDLVLGAHADAWGILEPLSAVQRTELRGAALELTELLDALAAQA